jgi:hypothetical protein
MWTPHSKFSHVDLVVSSIERSVPFYQGLLQPIGWSGPREMLGEQGETIYYLSVDGFSSTTRTESSSGCFTVRPTGNGFAAVRVIYDR